FRQHILNLTEEINKIKQRNNNLSKENQELKEREKQFLNENKKLIGENQELKTNLKERDEQFQQHVLNLEKQKNEQLEMISQNLVKTLEKLESDKVNENDINIKENNKSEPTTFSLMLISFSLTLKKRKVCSDNINKT